MSQLSSLKTTQDQFRAGVADRSSVSPTAMAKDAAILTKDIRDYGYCPPNTEIGNAVQLYLHDAEEDFFDLTKRTTNTTVRCFVNTARRLPKCEAVVTDTEPGTGSPPTGTVDFASSPIAAAFVPSSCILTVFSNSTVESSCTVNAGKPARLPPKGGATVTATYSGDGTHSASRGSGNLFPKP